MFLWIFIKQNTRNMIPYLFSDVVPRVIELRRLLKIQKSAALWVWVAGITLTFVWGSVEFSLAGFSGGMMIHSNRISPTVI
jgi:hypothetical protein